LDFSPGIAYFVGQLGKAFLDPGSHISLFSLAAACLIALAALARRRYRKGRRLRLSTLLRALFPKHVVFSRSGVADLGYFYFNVFLFGMLFGWALFSYEVLSRNLTTALAAALGPLPPAPLPAFVSRAIITVMLFLAYELAYWFE
jgi:hypothetical protein